MAEEDKKESISVVGTAEQLREILGPVGERAQNKVRTELHQLDREFLAASPFCLIATSGKDGSCDVSPKGDPPGFTWVQDKQTIAIPDRPGNRRADGLHNILENPQVGLIYFVPGRGDTLRINGRVTLVSDAPFLDQLTVKGNRPSVALLVAIDEVFFHCSKAFLRSELWDPEYWNPDGLPSRAEISKVLEVPDASLKDLENYYGEAYRKKLY